MVGMDTEDENMDIEIEVADPGRGSGDKQKHPPTVEGREKDHKKRHVPH